MSEVRIALKKLSSEQEAAVASNSRFHIISGGRESGKKTLAVEAALVGSGAALSGGVVAFFVPDDERQNTLKRMVLDAVGAIAKVNAKNRIDLATGGIIFFHVIQNGVLEFWNAVDRAIVVDAVEIDGFAEIWRKDIISLLNLRKGSGWIFSKPRGARNGFGHLFKAAIQDDSWSAAVLPSSANPRANLDEIEQARKKLSDELFQQEYMGVLVEGDIELSASQCIIGRDETFIQWCERLAEEGLMVDGHPFRLDDRPAMRWVYEQIPSTIEEAFGQILVLMKAAQVGFTVAEMLAQIYFALKWAPCAIGMYLPDMKLAGIKSSNRFMPIVRSVPSVYRLMVDESEGAKKGGEGSVLTKRIGGSRFYFLWTSGKATTESIPMDCLSFDEVQEMRIADMEKTRERLSASRIRYIIVGSTANWPDADVHWWYKRGTKHQFWTECPSCGELHVLDDYFPECIKFDEERRDYRYVCRSCGGWIDDSQRGEWRASEPDAKIKSLHFPQMLSPTITPREIIEAYFNADDVKSFYNRKLGKPYTDPSQVPVNMTMLNDCAEEGARLEVKWKSRARDTYMGIDQMGAFNVALICERMQSGHMAIIHAEAIYSQDPFARCDELMEVFGVAVCVVETLPNYNDAKRFSGRFPGRVFLAGYGDMKDDMLRWGDAMLDKSERKTSEEDRDRHTVTLDQYKCMQVALKRIQNKVCVFPDPDGLVQEVKDKGVSKMIAILREMVFLHFTRTALIAERDDEEKKYRRRVVKVGIDPHFSYAYMLMNVAWARAHGTSMFILPNGKPVEVRVERAEELMPGLPSGVLNMLESVDGTCSACMSFEEGYCSERNLIVSPRDPECLVFTPR